MGQGASTEVNQQTEKNGTKEVNEKGKEEEIKDIDKTGSLRKKAWLKRKPSDQKSPKSKKKGKENKKKGSQDKLSITTEEPEKEEVSHRLSRIELHLEECQPAPDDDTISLSSCGENVENHLQDVISDDNSTAADRSSSSCIDNNLTDSISKDDSEPLNNTSHLPLANKNQEDSNLSKKHDKLDDEIHDLKEIKGDINEKQDDSIEKQVESVEKQDGLIEKQDDLKENHDDLKEMINEKQDILKETEDVKQDDLKEAQVDLNEKKDDLKESQEDCNEKGDGINEIIHTSAVEVTEVCLNFKEDEDLVEHSQNVIPVNQTEEENDNKIVVSSENDALNLENKGESKTEESTVGVAVHVDDCHNIKDEHTTNTDFIASTQTNPDITFTNIEVASANLEDLESHEPKNDECEISSLSLDASSPLQDSRKDEIEIKDAVKQEVVEVTEIGYTIEQVESEIKSEPEVAPSTLVIQTEMMSEIKDVNSEETILNNGDEIVSALEESVDQEITHYMQIPNDDNVSLDSKTSKFDESITEIRGHLDDDIHHTSSMLSESETVCIVESNHQGLSVEMCSDETATEEDTTKVMDATVEELVPDSSVNDGFNHSELTENTENKEPQYKINLNERNMSDPEVLLETIRMMEEAKAKGPSVEIMTTDLDAEDLSEETTLHPVNNTEESKVNNIEINNLQNSNTNDEEGSIGEPSDQSLAMSSSTSTEQSDNVAKMKPTYTDNSNGTVFV
ncbi:uncharacterized protein PF11_0207 [Octopus sinensis]|uniref:Uncharacterized protein PF11_0207 n=1 Tax=Octopus sinensis TaxID=2607531 RepID=A0A7E6FT58_9MOLL|nr:uncharacterized protein PF11_0207 [Octopus sinensis]